MHTKSERHATPDTNATASCRLPPLPFVGRQDEMRALDAWMHQVASGVGGTQIVTGAGGVGKTRLVNELAARATKNGWTVAAGQGFPVETGVPYALFTDALTPVISALGSSALAVLTRGDSGAIANISPTLFQQKPASHGGDSAGDAKARLLWGVSQFLGQLAKQHPLLIVLENLQWADSSSLELLHFIARQAATQRVAILCTYNEEEAEANHVLRSTEQSLLSLNAAHLVRLAPLPVGALRLLVSELFHTDAASAQSLALRLHSWTLGNPFFAEEMLKALVDSGALQERAGVWNGWDADAPGLPRSIRDAVTARVDRLAERTRSVANLIAVIGTRVSHDAIVAVSGLPERDVLAALDDLRAHSVMTEDAKDGVVRYEFMHPLMRDVLYGALGLARRQLLHATVAEALEQQYGAQASAHADELAYHFTRAQARGVLSKAARYLAEAGANALERHANREAADYLSAALDQYDRECPDGDDASIDCDAVVEGLARARQRLGEYAVATGLWERARELAARAADTPRIAAIERRLGLGAYWSGRYADALSHFGVALTVGTGADESLRARVLAAQAMTLHALGDRDAARGVVDDALAVATRLGDAGVLARVLRTSLQLHLFVGDAEKAHVDALRAIGFAATAGERGVEWSVHWAMAIVGGLTGDGAIVAEHLAKSEQLADDLHSPVLGCWTAEIAIEYAAGIGDWDAGLARAEQAIPLARALGQRVLLPRLLVWAALIHLHRGAQARAKEYLDEGWALLSSDVVHHLRNVHSAVPVHAGLVAYHVSVSEHERALEIGEAGLALVDRSGYVAWGIHRLLPKMIEAALYLGDLGRAARYLDRLRDDSIKLGHRLGLAWVDTGDALIAMLRQDHQNAAVLLRRGADALDAVPWVFDAARLRCKLASVLTTLGDRDGAARELRRAHDVFVRLGAEAELTYARELIRERGFRPPARAVSSGVAGLTGREVDIARLAGAHKSNKEIGAELDISPRTVSTHMSNIFAKLAVASRGELADVARTLLAR
ncbi:MAG: AAA family ATPase [Gemmatimonadota bacterium]